MPNLPSLLTTQRLLIRPWTDADRPAFEQAVAESLDHLRPWLPWARAPLEEQWNELQSFLRKPESVHDVIYAMFDATGSKVLGGIGVHHRGGDDEREIGYWLHRDAVGNGFMTEAVSEMTGAVFAALPIDSITIFCDPSNTRSAAVPRRLGYHLEGIFPAKIITPDRVEDMIWRITRKAWRAGLEMKHAV
jgi:RimJ/RimL family protein N-acetyltransferase